MNNKKLLSTVLTLSLLVGGIITAHAAAITSSTINLIPNNGSDHSVDNYITAPATGAIKEKHYVSGGAYPKGTFTAVLELRTSWTTPNRVMDTTHYPNGENNASFTNGQQLRTLMSIDNTYAPSQYSLDYTTN